MSAGHDNERCDLVPWIDGQLNLSCESQINLAVSSTRLGRAVYVVLRIFK